MKRNFFIIIVLLFLTLYVQVYAAGTPSILSYQGRLADSGGDLLGGSSGTTYYFKFSIWDVSTGGTSGTNRLWPLSDPSSFSTTVRQGVFNVNIGDTENGYPDSLDYNFSDSADIYLQIEVSSDDSAFETLSPRQRISSVVFAQISGAVSGTGQSSFGTTTPVSGAVVTIEATTTSAVPLVIRGFLNQTADLFRIISDAGTRLLTFTSGGKLGIGTTTPNRKLNVLDVDSIPQMRLSQTGSVYSEFYVDNLGDLWLSSSGREITQDDGNFWVCSGGNCGVDAPADQGNIIVETSVVFDNGFRFKQTGVSTTIMYDTTNTAILEFDEG
ncbi:MAG: hypothetical protein KAR20_00345, partial [Candidatus Heimdallarchaeota archaeon]|nr:hypothetical protein [Candidatus Heimdallarchaeota archaeon]